MFNHSTNNLLRDILCELIEIREYITQPVLLQIQFDDQEPGMPVTINNDATASVVGTPVETNAAGAPVAIVSANIQWSMQTAGIAAMIQNADGSATFTPLSVGSTVVGVVDSVAQLSATDTLTVVAVTPPGGPTSLSISWGTPTA